MNLHPKHILLIGIKQISIVSNENIIIECTLIELKIFFTKLKDFLF